MTAKLFLFSSVFFIITSCTENKVPLITANREKEVIINTEKIVSDIPGISEKENSEKEEENGESLAFRFFNATTEFRQKVDENWYLESAVTSKRKVIKYFNEYRSRLIVDYDNKRVRIDTKLKEDMTSAVSDAFTVNLKSADADIFSDTLKKKIKSPYLLTGLVKKPENIEKLTIYVINNNEKPYFRTEIPFIENIKATDILAKKIDGVLSVYARKYRISKNFLSAMAKTLTENNSLYYDNTGYRFGLFALGENNLVNEDYEDKKEEVSYTKLVDLEGNIDYACKYFSTMKKNQFKRVFDKDVLEDLFVVSYIMGADNVLRLYSRNKQQAVSIINRINGTKFYDDLVKRIPGSVKTFLDNYKANYQK